MPIVILVYVSVHLQSANMIVGDTSLFCPGNHFKDVDVDHFALVLNVRTSS